VDFGADETIPYQSTKMDGIDFPTEIAKEAIVSQTFHICAWKSTHF
tara:strand:- start:363 stop:500 length:138 start_codon:yes stop_codon:yes gene_type:complete